jgi:hypothetical protein
LADAVILGGLSGHRPHSGGELGDGETRRRDRQRERCGEGGTYPGSVEVDPADSCCGDLRGCGQLVEDPVGQEADLDAVEHAGEAVDDAAEPGGDLRELAQCAATAELFGVMRDRLEAQGAFAFGVGLQREQSEVDLEDREVPPWFLDDDRLSGREFVAGAMRAAFASEQRADCRQVEPGCASLRVNRGSSRSLRGAEGHRRPGVASNPLYWTTVGPRQCAACVQGDAAKGRTRPRRHYSLGAAFAVSLSPMLVLVGVG